MPVNVIVAGAEAGSEQPAGRSTSTDWPVATAGGAEQLPANPVDSDAPSGGTATVMPAGNTTVTKSPFAPSSAPVAELCNVTVHVAARSCDTDELAETATPLTVPAPAGAMKTTLATETATTTGPTHRLQCERAAEPAVRSLAIRRL